MTGHLKKFADLFPDAVVILRDLGTIVWCNQAAQDLLGFSWSDSKDMPTSGLLRSPAFINYLVQGDFGSPLDIGSPIDQERVLELRIVVPHAENKFFLVARDVTQLRRLERAKQIFFANASHELRTPITVLKGYLEMTKDSERLVDLRQVKVYNAMMEQLSRMEGLVSQVLTLTEIKSMPTTFSGDFADTVDIPAMLGIIKSEASILSGEQQHKLDFEVDKTLMVLGSKGQLRSAISNLVHNAIKHTPPKSKVTVRWFFSDQGAYLEVEDTGEGIEKRHLCRLTEYFYRADKSRRQNAVGSGLGLAIVKHALLNHGTLLEIKSQFGVGSKFSFILPSRLVVQRHS